MQGMEDTSRQRKLRICVSGKGDKTWEEMKVRENEALGKLSSMTGVKRKIKAERGRILL